MSTSKEKMDKAKCPTENCGKKATTGRRVRGSWHYICNNGHSWDSEPKPEPQKPPKEWTYAP